MPLSGAGEKADAGPRRQGRPTTSTADGASGVRLQGRGCALPFGSAHFTMAETAIHHAADQDLGAK
jgi:hypothetical protein